MLTSTFRRVPAVSEVSVTFYNLCFLIPVLVATSTLYGGLLAICQQGTSSSRSGTSSSLHRRDRTHGYKGYFVI